MKNLDAQIIANPRVFEVGRPNERAKKIMRESKGIRIGTKECKKVSESKKIQ